MTVRVLARPGKTRAGAAPPLPIARRFLRVGGREVHYLRAGDGPPAVLVHSSPANAWLLRPEIEHLAGDFTVFAFDTPGFGRSDPLPMAKLHVADLADALAETLGAIGMPASPVYGTHTGAAIALELAVRHPHLVTGLVLDGLPAFTREEHDRLFGGYFRPFPVSELGGQYAEVWTRFRDQSVWFPWTARRPEALNAYDLSQPEATHAWASMYFDCQEHYVPAYSAALGYCEAALEGVERLARPAIFTATPTDMLFPHLARLPPLKATQEIRHIDGDPASKHDLIREGFARFPSHGAAPADPGVEGGGARIARGFVDRRGGGQTHVRVAGEAGAPPLLLLHDAPGSAEALAPLIEALAPARRVIAPDLPGTGESDPLRGERALDLGAYAEVLADLLDDLEVARAEVHGVGFGASAALALAGIRPRLVAGLALEGLLLPTEPERAELSRRYAPPIAIEPDGSHWYRTWLMLRDQRIWAPWYERTVAAQRRRPGNFDARDLHRQTVEVMRRRETYGQVIAAAVRQDAALALARLACPVGRIVGGATPLSLYDERLRDLAPAAPQAEAAEVAADHAASLLALFGDLS